MIKMMRMMAHMPWETTNLTLYLGSKWVGIDPRGWLWVPSGVITQMVNKNIDIMILDRAWDRRHT